MTDSIDKLIDAKIVSGLQPLRGDIRQGIRELMQDHAKQVATELLLGMHSYRLNGIGEIQQVNNYELGDTDLTVDDVIAISALEFEENDEVMR